MVCFTWNEFNICSKCGQFDNKSDQSPATPLKVSPWKSIFLEFFGQNPKLTPLSWVFCPECVSSNWPCCEQAPLGQGWLYFFDVGHCLRDYRYCAPELRVLLRKGESGIWSVRSRTAWCRPTHLRTCTLPSWSCRKSPGPSEGREPQHRRHAWKTSRSAIFRFGQRSSALLHTRLDGCLRLLPRTCPSCTPPWRTWLDGAQYVSGLLTSTDRRFEKTSYRWCHRRAGRPQSCGSRLWWYCGNAPVRPCPRVEVWLLCDRCPRGLAGQRNPPPLWGPKPLIRITRNW